MSRIFVIGSSSAFGAHVRASESWPGLLRDELEAPQDKSGAKGCDVYNLATSGQTLEDSIELIEALPSSLMRRVNFLIVAAGAIVANARPGPEDYSTTPEQLVNRLEYIRKLTVSPASHFSGVFFVTGTPIRNVGKPEFFKGAYFAEQRAHLFARTMLEYGRMSDALIINAYDAIGHQPEWRQTHMADLIHPNAIGHAAIYAAARPVILPELARQGAFQVPFLI